MKKFTTNPEGFKEVRKQAIGRSAPILFFATLIGVVLGVTNSGNEDMTVLFITIPMILLVTGFGLYRGIKRQEALYESYTLTITDLAIIREQLNTPTVSIYQADVTDISKNKNGDYIIRGQKWNDVINIPAQIDNYDELETYLAGIKPMATNTVKPSLLDKNKHVLSLATLGLMICVFAVTNKFIVAISGVLFIAILLWSFFEVQKNKNIDAKTKRGAWWILVVLASVIGVMVMKLTAPY